MNGPETLWNRIGEYAPSTMTDLANMLGVRQVAEMIQQMSERPIKLASARRTVERYRVAEAKAAGASTKAEQSRLDPARLNSILQKAQPAIRQALADKLRHGQLDTSASGKVQVSKKKVRADVRTIDGPIDGHDLEALADAYARDNMQDGWDAYQEVLFDAYGLPHDGYDTEFIDDEVDSLTFDLQ